MYIYKIENYPPGEVALPRGMQIGCLVPDGQPWKDTYK